MVELATPLLTQYNRIKRQYQNHILMFRLGDFYEMFNDDARIASQVLDIALTKKSVGKNRTVPLAGIPYHAVDSYLARLIKAGHKVAICEQVEDPKQARGLVKREVIRVVTPGTVLESTLLDDKSNNYLIAIHKVRGRWGAAAVDLSTGDFLMTELAGSPNDPEAERELYSELVRLQPAELLIPEDLVMEAERVTSQLDQKITLTRLENNYFQFAEARERLLQHFGVTNFAGFGVEQEDEYRAALSSAGAVIAYLQETQKGVVPHLTSLRLYKPTDYMILDQTTQQGLELVRNLHTGSKEGTLLKRGDPGWGP